MKTSQHQNIKGKIPSCCSFGSGRQWTAVDAWSDLWPPESNQVFELQSTSVQSSEKFSLRSNGRLDKFIKHIKVAAEETKENKKPDERTRVTSVTFHRFGLWKTQEGRSRRLVQHHPCSDPTPPVFWPNTTCVLTRHHPCSDVSSNS